VLKVAFSVLFGIACVKDASVADNREVLGGSIQWNVSFIREAHDWELDIFASFFFFFRCWIQLERGEGEKITYGGFLPKGGSSRLRSSIIPCVVM
jgi:hypothetical protein